MDNNSSIKYNYKIIDKKTERIIKKFRLKAAALAYWNSLYMNKDYEIVNI
jgi:hypothetical protein